MGMQYCIQLQVTCFKEGNITGEKIDTTLLCTVHTGLRANQFSVLFSSPGISVHEQPAIHMAR